MNRDSTEATAYLGNNAFWRMRVEVDGWRKLQDCIWSDLSPEAGCPPAGFQENARYHERGTDRDATSILIFHVEKYVATIRVSRRTRSWNNFFGSLHSISSLHSTFPANSERSC